MTFTPGDKGETKCGLRYRILATDLLGDRGPIAAAVKIAEEELLYRYGPDGTHAGPNRAYDLKPAGPG